MCDGFGDGGRDASIRPRLEVQHFPQRVVPDESHGRKHGRGHHYPQHTQKIQRYDRSHQYRGRVDSAAPSR